MLVYWICINKVNEIYFPVMMFTAHGIIYCIERCKKMKSGRYAGACIAALYGIYFLLFSYFFYAGGEHGLNYITRFQPDDYIVVDIRPGQAIGEIKEDFGAEKNIQLIINDVEGRYENICLFAGTSPYDFNADGYVENGYEIGVPGELDMSGDTVYMIEDELHHITDYLVTQGFTNRVAEHGKFSIVYKD